jgi:putative transposase
VQKVRRTQSEAVERSPLAFGEEPVLSLAVVAATLYSILRILLDAIATQRDRAKLQAEVLALRRQVQVLERQIKRLEWTPADRMVLTALRDRLPRSAWAALRVQSETVLGWL